MVVYDPRRLWHTQGACRGLSPKEVEALFFCGGTNQTNRPPAPKTQEAWNEAKRVCAACPVLQECRRDTLGEEYGVWGGLDQYERRKVRSRLSAVARKWPKAERLEWASILASMRDAGLPHGQVFRRTGIAFALAEELIKEWEAGREEPAPAVVDLPLPGHRKDLPFPQGPGKAHAWVRHNGMITDAWYIAETSDGKWIYVQTWAGPGRRVRKWIAMEDAQIYQPQRAVIQEYRSRPDVPAA